MASNEQPLAKLEQTLQPYFLEKAPFQLPQNIRELLVKIAPWLTLFGIIVSLPLVLFALGLGALAAPLSFLAGPLEGVTYGMNYTISMIVMAISIVLEALAIPGLFSRSIKAWRLVFYATLLGVLSNLIQFNFMGLIIGGLISLYILFQIKPLYK